MIAGRIVWGLVSAILLENLTLHIFLSAAIFNAIPGIIVQLILVPTIISVVNLKKRFSNDLSLER